MKLLSESPHQCNLCSLQRTNPYRNTNAITPSTTHHLTAGKARTRITPSDTLCMSLPPPHLRTPPYKIVPHHTGPHLGSQAGSSPTCIKGLHFTPPLHQRNPRQYTSTNNGNIRQGMHAVAVTFPDGVGGVAGGSGHRDLLMKHTHRSCRYILIT
jgi:hypothetical protein